MDDSISVAGLVLWASVGISEVERRVPQKLRVWVTIVPERGFGDTRDEIANTVDYAVVSKAILEETARRPRNLIETLAEEFAAMLLARFPIKAVEIEIRKYVLLDAEYAAVRLRRERSLGIEPK